MNGVINIITKDAADTHGIHASAGFGNREQFASLRQGASLGRDLDLRVHAKYFASDRLTEAEGPNAGNEAFDAIDRAQEGFRLDWTPGDDDHLTLQVDLRDARLESRDTQFYPDLSTGVPAIQENVPRRPVRLRAPPVEPRLHRGLGRHDPDLPGPDQSPSNSVHWDQTTYDVEAQHRFRVDLGIEHEVIWGATFRQIRSEFRFRDRPGADWIPGEDVNQVASGFVQEQATLVPDLLFLTTGVKAEWNDFTGWEPQPNVRLAVRPAEDHILWTAYSRAIRLPARAERDIEFPNVVVAIPLLDPIVVSTIGNKDLEAETADSFEVGYRGKHHETVFFDVAAYYTENEDVVGFGLGEPEVRTDPIRYFLVPNDTNNEISWESWGIETTLQWQPLEELRLGINHTHFEGEIDFGDAFPAPPDAAFELPSMNPAHQIGFRAGVDFPADVEADVHVFYVDELAVESPLQTITIDAYTRLDLRLAWSPFQRVTLTAVGQNLLDPEHEEFLGTFGTPRSTIPRTYYGSIALDL